MNLCDVTREGLFSYFLERAPILAKLFSQEQRSGKDYSSAVRLDSHQRPGFFGYRISTQLPEDSQASREIVLGKEKLYWGGCSTHHKSLEKSVKLYWLGKNPHPLLTLPHLQQ